MGNLGFLQLSVPKKKRIWGKCYFCVDGALSWPARRINDLGGGFWWRPPIAMSQAAVQFYYVCTRYSDGSKLSSRCVKSIWETYNDG